MTTNRLLHAVAIEHMLAANALVIDTQMFQVKGCKSLTPVGVFTQTMFYNDDLMHFIVKTMAYHVPEYVTHVAGFGHDGTVLAYLIAKASGRIPVPLQNTENGNIAGFKSPTPLSGANVLLIPGIIATGRNSAKDIVSIETAGGVCTNIFPIFDYGFNLNSNVARRAHIDALVTTHTLEAYLASRSNHLSLVTQWKDRECNLFRSQSWVLGERPIVQPKKESQQEIAA